MIKRIINPITPIIIFGLSQVGSWSLQFFIGLFEQNSLMFILAIIVLGIFGVVLPIIGIAISILLIARKEKVILSITGLILNLAPFLFTLFIIFFVSIWGLQT